MKPEKYKSIRAKNYCTRCWKRHEPQNMYLNGNNKLICKECLRTLIELEENITSCDICKDALKNFKRILE